MTPVQRVARDNAIVRMRVKGRTWASIAADAGLGERRCQQIVDEWRASSPQLRNRDPVLIVEEMLERYESMQEDLAELADESDGNVKVGAINSRMSAMRQATELMQATGILPNDLGRLRVEMDVRVLAAKLVAVLEAEGATEDLQVKLLDAIEGTRPDAG